MLKTLMITTALSGALMGAAQAQSPAPESTPPAATTSPPMTTPPMASPPMTPGSSGAATATTVVSAQKPDQWLASKFRGTDVIGADDVKIGDVSDVLLDKNGTVQAYVVGVGGFLGIGQKDVALAPTAFQILPADADNSYDRLRLSMTKDQLQQAANFEPYNAPTRTTTGSGTGSTTMPVTPSTSR